LDRHFLITVFLRRRKIPPSSGLFLTCTGQNIFIFRSRHILMLYATVSSYLRKKRKLFVHVCMYIVANPHPCWSYA
jgi:hypothetical protein